jgi:hypothetical protein
MCLLYVQYLPHAVHTAKPVFNMFSVIFTIAIVWLYAYIVTVSGAYKNVRTKTQVHCRVDRSGLVSGASWLVVCANSRSHRLSVDPLFSYNSLQNF